MFGSALFAALPISTGLGPDDAVYLGAHSIVLVEGRANEVTVPHVFHQAVNTRLMEWDVSQRLWVGAATPTRISQFCRQINHRYTGSDTLNSDVIKRVESIDADTGNKYVFTPGATPVGSLQDFQVIIPDQDGDFESRGFVIFLQDDANPDPGIDGGDVVLHFTNLDLPWS